jgi:hypothetical protein
MNSKQIVAAVKAVNKATKADGLVLISDVRNYCATKGHASVDVDMALKIAAHTDRTVDLKRVDDPKRCGLEGTLTYLNHPCFAVVVR